MNGHPLRETLAALPPVWSEDPVPVIAASNKAADRSIVVLDDDPTGTQTVHDIPVLTEWSVACLEAELASGTPLFYILTNSRSLPEVEAKALAVEIGTNLQEASTRSGRGVSVISRSDSTLRGHYPLEVDALLDSLQCKNAVHVLAPFFEEGGRFTIGDEHFVAEGDQLIPAADTPFAKDASFGFRSSNLRDWVQEKTAGRIPSSDVVSISIQDVRIGGPGAVTKKLRNARPGMACVVNAATMRDIEVFVEGLLEAERLGGTFIVRSAASYVRARAGLSKRPLLEADVLRNRDSQSGGLIVVGSYVPKTTAQLKALTQHTNGPVTVELKVAELLGDDRPAAIAAAVDQIDSLLGAGTNAVLFTSRELVTGQDAAGSLAIGSRVSSALVEIVRSLRTAPSFLIAKGGITSSDVATKGLGVKRAMVRGQILPGVPVWLLGEESRFPGMNYIVFPGNVGGNNALADAYDKLTSCPHDDA